MNFDRWMEDLDLDWEVSLRWFATPEIIYNHVMPREIAEQIERAANLAFTGRWGEAQQARVRAGYGGLELIDNGAVAKDSESSRDNFRRLLDENDPDL